MENNWRQKTLENLEKDIWPALSPEEETQLIKTCTSLRKKPIQEFSTEDLRIMIGQEIGIHFLMPLAIETLTKDLFAEGDLYEGDLLKAVLEIKSTFWDDHKEYWKELNELIKNRRQEIENMKFNLSKFDHCKQ